jgi:uncharacterized RDD family membrane protein YckC
MDRTQPPWQEMPTAEQWRTPPGRPAPPLPAPKRQAILPRVYAPPPGLRGLAGLVDIALWAGIGATGMLLPDGAGMGLVAFAVVLGVANTVVLQGLTGWTIGKLICGLRLVHVRTGRPIGMGRALLRTLIKTALDALTWGHRNVVRFTRPDVDPRRRNWADEVVDAMVVQTSTLRR